MDKDNVSKFDGQFDPYYALHTQENEARFVTSMYSDTARFSKSFRTADCDTIHTIYLFLCTQSAVRTLLRETGSSRNVSGFISPLPLRKKIF